MKKSEGEEFRKHLDEIFDKYVPKVLKVKKTRCKEFVRSSESASVMNLCKFFDALGKNLKRNEEDDAESHKVYVEKFFVFCLVWSIGATLEDD